MGDSQKSCVEGPLSLFFDSDSGRCEVPDRLARIGDSQWSSSESWKILWFPAKGIKEFHEVLHGPNGMVVIGRFTV